MLDRVQVIEEDLRILKRLLPPKARFAFALARTRERSKNVRPKDIATAASRAVRAVRRSASHRSA